MWNEFLAWATVRALALREDERGQTAVEYAMVIGLVAIVLAVALAAGGLNVFGTLWTRVTNAINGSTTA
jgi:Flp pilus assembly pilin Flp